MIFDAVDRRVTDEISERGRDGTRGVTAVT